MARTYRTLILLITALTVTGLLLGCGSGKKEGAESPVAPPARVGSESCVNTCHANTVDITGTAIAQAWENTSHTTVRGVQCEDCHGGASLHWGVGPIPFSRPQAAQCEVCHTDKTGFDATAHANQHLQGGTSGPDVFFFQGGTGTDQANNRGVPETTPGGAPVTKNQHIQECSMCHNPNQRFVYDQATGQLVKPDPNTVFDPTNINTWEGLQNPQVSCASCHDAHQAEQMVSIAQRSAPVGYPIFRKFLVNPTGEQSFTVNLFTGNETPTPGASSFAGFIYQPNGAVQSLGTVDPSKVAGTNNELTVERFCASCHTVSKYLFSQQPTHQTDVYTQWKQSAHGDRTEPPFAEFSANPPEYGPYSAGSGSHQSLWPYDMRCGSSTGGGGNRAATAAPPTSPDPATCTNAAVSDGRGGYNDNFQCYRCHNGITSIAYQEDTQGTSDAPVVFGDEPVMCITCHDPHENGPGLTTNLRKPVVMTKYEAASTEIPFSFSGNVFLDNTPVPDETGNATVCVFCHQGRESGLTLFKERLASDGTLTNKSFLNPHYLGTGAMLWARNGYEYAGKMYGMVVDHQQTNCYGCHMADGVTPEVGGHTWKIVSDDDAVVNSVTCNTSSCHDGRVPTTNSGDQFDDFRDTVYDPTNDYNGDGLIEGIPVEIAGLEDRVIALLYANGIEYDDTAYPYFFIAGQPHTNANAFKSWSLATLKAAFNLSYVIKGLPSGPSQIGEPNTSAATHNYRYNIELLHDSYEDLYNNTPPASIPPGSPAPGAMARPSGSRPATNYDPQLGGGYNPRQ
jgi:hypothetical protein